MRLEPLRSEDSERVLALYLEAFLEWERAEPEKLESFRREADLGSLFEGGVSLVPE